jgi:hypothetical protein
MPGLARTYRFQLKFHTGRHGSSVLKIAQHSVRHSASSWLATDTTA